MITEYRIIKPLFFIQQTILSAFDMPGTALGKGTGKKKQMPLIQLTCMSILKKKSPG